MMNNTGCGISSDDSKKDLAIWATESAQTFSFDNLRRKQAPYKFTQMGVCVYQILAPKLAYKNGNVSLTFNSIDPDVRLYLQAGESRSKPGRYLDGDVNTPLTAGLV